MANIYIYIGPSWGQVASVKLRTNTGYFETVLIIDQFYRDKPTKL